MDAATVVSLTAEGFEVTIRSERDTPGHVCCIRSLVPVREELTCLAIDPGEIGVLRQLLVHIEAMYNRR